ncbi:MAG: alpha/beta hydrolase [Solobacterium sp.]|nr:alpha/beta hydrolase [Solobacterium sp.]
MIIKRPFWYPPGNSDRTLHIYLPDDYYSTEERYPVIYFFDGHNLFFNEDATYGTCWGLKGFLDRWHKKIIIVGMECSHVNQERLSEYCPYEKHFFGKTIHGKGKETFDWIVHEIKPMIDKEYRTWGHREATGIAGSSMGGIMSMYGIIRYNDIFSKAACVSTGIFWNLSDFRKDLKQVQLSPDTRIYMSWGEIESGKAAHNGNPEFDTREARSTRKFEKELQAKNARTYLYFQPNGRHCEADWAAQVPLFLDWLWLQP